MEGSEQLKGEEPSKPHPHSHLYPAFCFFAGVTGGLAAPLVAAGAATIIGSAGAAALGSVAGIAVMTSLFGAAGASLTGQVRGERWAMRAFGQGGPAPKGRTQIRPRDGSTGDGPGFSPAGPQPCQNLQQASQRTGRELGTGRCTG